MDYWMYSEWPRCHHWGLNGSNWPEPCWPWTQSLQTQPSGLLGPGRPQRSRCMSPRLATCFGSRTGSHSVKEKFIMAPTWLVASYWPTVSLRLCNYYTAFQSTAFLFTTTKRLPFMGLPQRDYDHSSATMQMNEPQCKWHFSVYYNNFSASF